MLQSLQVLWLLKDAAYPLSVSYKICTRAKIVAPIVYFMYAAVITSDFPPSFPSSPRIEWQQAIGMLRSRTSYTRIKMLLTEAYGTKTWDTVSTACPTQPRTNYRSKPNREEGNIPCGVIIRRLRARLASPLPFHSSAAVPPLLIS